MALRNYSDRREAIVSKLGGRVMRRMRQMRDRHLRENSGLEPGLHNTWEEYCVQIQHDQGYYFEYYVWKVEELAQEELNKLKGSEALITNLLDELAVAEGADTTLLSEIYSDVAERAGGYENSRIRAYIYGWD